MALWNDEQDGWDQVFSPDPMGPGTTTGDRTDSERQTFDTVFSTGTETPGMETPAPTPASGTSQDDYWRSSVSGIYDRYLGRSAQEGDFAASAGNPGGLAGIEQTVRSSPEARGYSQVNQYQQAVRDLGSITDPQQAAVRRDQLARDIYTNLQNAGHAVRWNGDTLVVDGREYQIAGAQTAATGQPTPGAQTTMWGFNSPTGGRGEMSYSAPSYEGEIGAYSGYEANRIGQDDSIKYRWLEFTRGLPPTVESLPEIVRRLNASGIPARQIGYDKIDFGLGEGPVDVVNQTRGGVWDWMPDGANRTTSTTPSGPVVPTATAGIRAADTGAGAVQTSAPQSTTAAGSWTPTAPTYTPGEITTDDLEGLSYDDLMAALGPNYQPGDVNAGAVEDPLEQSVLNLLRNPTALDERTVETLKARSKEEQAGLYEQELADLTSLGARNNIADSNWLQAERLGARRDRDERLIRGNREVDLEAARTRRADERAAIATGQTYADSRRSNAQRNIDNQFRSQAEQRAAVSLASNTQLAAAAERGDRMALREQIQQRAVELGQNADETMLQYTLGLLSDATNRYGIDVGAQIDRERLSQAGREFQEELAFRISSFAAQLSQDDAQFGANWRLNAGRLQLDADNSAWDRYQQVFGD